MPATRQSRFVQSHVEQLSDNIKESSTDAIFFCNAIHYVSDKDALIAEVTKSLKPGGKFAFNTSFFDGGQPPEVPALLPQVDAEVVEDSKAGVWPVAVAL